jgi:iron complex outermembrane receptor protein
MRCIPLLILLAISLSAQQPVHQSIVVSGTWEPIPLEEADRAILSLPVRELRLTLISLPDLLRLDPSLDLRQRAPNGLQGDLSIRGATFGQTLVLLNGRRMSDPQSGHHSMDIPVPLEAVETVEVLRGAGSTLYGSDALGGVVNIITSTPERAQLRTRAALGNAGAQQQSLSAGGVFRQFSQRLSLARDFSSGFATNRDYRFLSASSSSTLRTRLGTGGLELAGADRAYGAENFYGAYPSWERTKTWFAAARQQLGTHTDAAFSYRRHTDLFYLYRDNPQRYQNHHVAESYQASLRRRDELKHGLTFHSGAEMLADSISSSNLGQHARARGSAYAALDARALGRFSFSAGLRTESWRGAFDQISPSLAGGYWATSKVKLRASLSRAYRVPTFTELYYKDPANQGNAALHAETAWSREAGADWRPSSNWRLQTTVFDRLDRNGIDYMSTSASGPWKAANITQVRFTGLETSAGLRWRSQVFDWSYAALRGRSTLASGIFTKYSYNYPVHSGIFSWTASLGHYTARTRLGALERRDRSPYAVWDVSLARAGRRIRPFIQLSNLTGTHYEEVLTVAMPGRTFLGGVELIFW